MKTLTHFGDSTGLIFNGENASIAKWVADNLDKFNLNEEHSCMVHLEGGLIIIRGDEDRMELLIEKQEIIEL